MNRGKPATLALAISLVAMSAWAESGGDLVPTGVSTEAIQLPKPAGTIQGFGSEASSVGNTGAATYSIPIEVPKGRNGLQPSLTLSYNSSVGAGSFGLGWFLDIATIERSGLRGVPRYLNSDLLSSSIDGELVNLGEDRYRPLIDKSQSQYRYDASSDQWARYEGNGLVHVFGAEGARVETWAGAYKWLISSTEDPFGNRIEYSYNFDGGQAYISQITYADLYTVYFGYGERPDTLKSYASTQGIETRLRCNDIWVRANQLIRHYQLEYEQSPNGEISRLKTVRLYGRDDTTKYPDLVFSYADEPAAFTQKSKSLNFDTSGPKAFPPALNNARVNIADLTEDGIPDILESREDGAFVWPGNGDGSFRAGYRLPGMRVALGTKNSKLLDVDGDRRVDVMGSGLYPKFWPGDGNGGFGAAIDVSSFPRYSVGSAMVKTFDVNGDGKLDLVAQEPDQIWVFFNGGEGRWDRRVKIDYNEPGTAYPVFNFSSPRTYFSDMNGDGLVDIAAIGADKVYYYPNRGNGYWDTPVTMTFAGEQPSQILTFARYEKNVYVTDINSDGLQDLLLVLPNSILYAFNRGDGRFGATHVYNGVHETPLDNKGIYVTLADVNGNGTQDILWSNDLGQFRYFDFNETIKPNLLVEIRNGLGKRTVLEYSPHTRYGTNPLLGDDQGKIPYPVHTVKSIKTYSWQTLVNETQFRYFGGYYDGKKNEFRGFRLIERLQPGDDSVPDLLDRRFFEVGRAGARDKERGLMLSQELRHASIGRKTANWALLSDGPVLKGETSEYQTLEIALGIYGTTAGFALEQKKTSIEGDETGATRSFDSLTSYTVDQGVIQSKTTRTFDNQGNLYRLIRDTYALGISDGIDLLWNVSNLAERIIEDGARDIVQSTQFYFDNSSVIGQVTRGKITQQDKLQGASYVTKNRYGWTGDGNLAWFEDAASHRTTIDYEPNYRLFPNKVTNTKGHVQRAVYDWDRGVISSAQDVNVNWTYYSYDPFLRLSKVMGPAKDPTLLDPAHPALEVLYSFGNDEGTPSTITTKKLTDLGKTTTTDSKAYFDPLGRSLGTILQGPPGKFVHTGGAEYNIRGKIKKKYLPFFVSGFAEFAPNLTRPFIKTSFDILGRATQSFNPEHTDASPSLKTTIYKVGETQNIDELGKLTKNQFDFLGRLTGVVNAKNYKTSYGYTVTNQLAEIVDAKGSKTLFEYDTLDRRSCKVDPNLGKTLYFYNDLDLLTEKRDFGFEFGITSCSQANANTPRVTSYQYNDPLNRITQMAFSDLNTAPVGYSYDFGPEGIGRLTGTTFEIGSKALTYDLFGNVTATDYTIDGQNFRIEEKFDLQGRILEVDYPIVSGVVLKVGYEFDEAGNLKRVYNKDTNENYASNLAYNELNQIHNLEFGNGVKTRMNYDVGQGSYRLTDILTYRGPAIGDDTPLAEACASGSSIQCLSYSYDKVSNITQISDLMAMKQRRMQSIREFGYDDLHQLTHAEGPWGVQNFWYDEIGNILSKSTVSAPTRSGIGWLDRLTRKSKALVPGVAAVQEYSYELNRPQILTGVGSDAYQFDPYGNLQAINAKSFAFDSINHLARFQNGSADYRYFYDENGERVLKSSASEKVYFPSKYFEKRGSQVYRYLFAGAKRIGVVAQNGTDVTYIHADHLGSSNYATDGAGNVSLHREFAPYGEMVVESGSNSLLRHGYTDKYGDFETSFSYFGARFYMPHVGRWASPDRVFAEKVGLGDRQELQLWQYGLGNPLKYNDSDGNAVNLVTAGVGAVVGGAVTAGLAYYQNPNQNVSYYAAAFAGGAVSGAALGFTLGLSAPATLGVGAAFSGVGSAAQQTINIYAGNQAQFSTSKLGVDIALGSLGTLAAARVGGNALLERGLSTQVTALGDAAQASALRGMANIVGSSRSGANEAFGLGAKAMALEFSAQGNSFKASVQLGLGGGVAAGSEAAISGTAGSLFDSNSSKMNDSIFGPTAPGASSGLGSL